MFPVESRYFWSQFAGINGQESFQQCSGHLGYSVFFLQGTHSLYQLSLVVQPA